MNESFMKIQHQIRQNTADHHKFVADLNKWQETSKEQEDELLQKRIIEAQKKANKQAQLRAAKQDTVSKGHKPSRTRAAVSKTSYRLISTKTEELYLEEKQKGNTAFKKADYKAALDHYSICVSLLPDEPVAFSNRAQTYLLCLVPSLALADADAALDCLEHYVPYHVGTDAAHALSAATPRDLRHLRSKTIFRRACALKLMGEWRRAGAEFGKIGGALGESSEVAVAKADMRDQQQREKKVAEAAAKATEKKAKLIEVEVLYGLNAEAELEVGATGDAWVSARVEEAEEEPEAEVAGNVEVAEAGPGELQAEPRATSGMDESSSPVVEREEPLKPEEPQHQHQPEPQHQHQPEETATSLGNADAEGAAEDDDEDLASLPALAGSTAELEVALRQLQQDPLRVIGYLLAHGNLQALPRLIAPIFDATLLGTVLTGARSMVQMQRERFAEGLIDAGHCDAVLKAVAKLLKVLTSIRAFSLVRAMVSADEAAAVRVVVAELRARGGDDKYLRLVRQVESGYLDDDE